MNVLNLFILSLWDEVFYAFAEVLVSQHFSQTYFKLHFSTSTVKLETALVLASEIMRQSFYMFEHSERLQKNYKQCLVEREKLCRRRLYFTLTTWWQLSLCFAKKNTFYKCFSRWTMVKKVNDIFVIKVVDLHDLHDDWALLTIWKPANFS